MARKNMKKTKSKQNTRFVRKLIVSLALVGVAVGTPIAASANNSLSAQVTKTVYDVYGAARVGWGGCGGCSQ
jgi:hypothetical protein